MIYVFKIFKLYIKKNIIKYNIIITRVTRYYIYIYIKTPSINVILLFFKYNFISLLYYKVNHTKFPLDHKLDFSAI